MIGPVVAVLFATPAFMNYKSGIFSDFPPNYTVGCQNVNHAVLVTGKILKIKKLQAQRTL